MNHNLPRKSRIFITWNALLIPIDFSNSVFICGTQKEKRGGRDLNLNHRNVMREKFVAEKTAICNLQLIVEAPCQRTYLDKTRTIDTVINEYLAVRFISAVRKGTHNRRDECVSVMVKTGDTILQGCEACERWSGTRSTPPSELNHAFCKLIGRHLYERSLSNGRLNVRGSWALV